MRRKKNNRWQTAATILFAIIFSGLILIGSSSFWVGYHNVDLSQNFCRNNYGMNTFDQTSNGEVVSLLELYLNGLRQLETSYLFLVLALFTGMILVGLIISQQNEK